MELGTLALLRAQAAHKLIKILQAGINWKGNVNTYSDLPSSATELDAYTVLQSDDTNKAGIYAYINNAWKFFLTCLELDQVLSTTSEKAVANKAVAVKFNSITTDINTLQESLSQAITEFKAALVSEVETREQADTSLQESLDKEISARIAEDETISKSLSEAKELITEEITKIYTELNDKSSVSISNSAVAGAKTAKSINVNGEDWNIPEGGSSGGVSQEYVDTQDQSVLTTLRTELEAEATIRKQAVENLTPYSIDLTGTSGTLTDEQRETLLKGSPTLNFINKDHMLFRCVYYNEDTKAVYSISGEAKIHVITVTLPAGTWELTTYELQSLLTAGDHINIDSKTNTISSEVVFPENFLATITKTEAGVVTVVDQDGNKTIFQTGGGTGTGVTQEYVDTQDNEVATQAHNEIIAVSQSVEEISEALANETTNRQNADTEIKNDLSAEVSRATKAEEVNATSIVTETTAREASDANLQKQIDSCATKTELESTASALETSIESTETSLKAEIAEKESSSNKVNTLTASATNFPTCDAVIAYIEALDGDNDSF